MTIPSRKIVHFSKNWMKGKSKGNTKYDLFIVAKNPEFPVDSL